MSDLKKQKQSLYFPSEMLDEIKAEACRLDRSLSWMIQRAWRNAREELHRMPSATSDYDLPEGSAARK